jgi:hypothetical protein
MTFYFTLDYLTGNFALVNVKAANPHPGDDLELESAFLLLQEDGTSSIQEEA